MNVRDGFAPQPEKITACERCVYGTGAHASFCEWRPFYTAQIDASRIQVSEIDASKIKEIWPGYWKDNDKLDKALKK